MVDLRLFVVKPRPPLVAADRLLVASDAFAAAWPASRDLHQLQPGGT